MSSHTLFKCSVFFFCKQKTAYEMRIGDWSSDVCSSDLGPDVGVGIHPHAGRDGGDAVGGREVESADDRRWIIVDDERQALDIAVFRLRNLRRHHDQTGRAS